MLKSTLCGVCVSVSVSVSVSVCIRVCVCVCVCVSSESPGSYKCSYSLSLSLSLALFPSLSAVKGMTEFLCKPEESHTLSTVEQLLAGPTVTYCRSTWHNSLRLRAATVWIFTAARLMLATGLGGWGECSRNKPESLDYWSSKRHRWSHTESVIWRSIQNLLLNLQ